MSIYTYMYIYICIYIHIYINTRLHIHRFTYLYISLYTWVAPGECKRAMRTEKVVHFRTERALYIRTRALYFDKYICVRKALYLDGFWCFWPARSSDEGDRAKKKERVDHFRKENALYIRKWALYFQKAALELIAEVRWIRAKGQAREKGWVHFHFRKERARHIHWKALEVVSEVHLTRPKRRWREKGWVHLWERALHMH